MPDSFPTTSEAASAEHEAASGRRVRADAQRNIDALLTAAAAVFAESGVDAPVREITARAGVGTGTLYRHYPLRSDLVAAVYRHEVDACADAAPVLDAQYEPMEALIRWVSRLQGFFGTKRGLASALHSGDPAYEELPEYFRSRFEPALGSLLDAAAAAGEVRDDVEPFDLIKAVAQLSMAADGPDDPFGARMVELLVDGLRVRGSA